MLSYRGLEDKNQTLRADEVLKSKMMNKEQRSHTAVMLPRRVCFRHIDCFKSKGYSAGSSCEANSHAQFVHI